MPGTMVSPFLLYLFHYYLIQYLLSSGVSLNKAMLYSKIKEKYYNSQCIFSEHMLHGTSYPNALHVFVKRSIDKLGFADKKKSIAQKIPLNWGTIAREGAQEVRDKFKEVGVETVCYMDEFFNNWHCAGKPVLVPTGAKRVGSAQQLGNEKEGCTVVTTMMQEASAVLSLLLYLLI